MSATTMLFAVLFAWLLIGILCSFVMARRGHDPWSWGVLGALFGPLVVPLAMAATRRDRQASSVVATWHRGTPGAGPISVLVGVDGSPDAEAAACSVVELLGTRIGRLIFATVLDYDAADATRRGEGVFTVEAQQILDDAAGAVLDIDPDTSDVDPDSIVLTGRPAEALLLYARDNDVDLLAVGTHGRGFSTAMLGSVAAHLVRQRDIPVLVAGTAAFPASALPTY